MVDKDREEIIKKQAQKEQLNGSTANMPSSSSKHTGNLSLRVLHLSPEPEVTTLQLPRCHSRIAMVISREMICTCSGEIDNNLQHKSQECYRNSHKTPNPPEILICAFERGAQLSITNRTAHITSDDSSGVLWEGQKEKKKKKIKATADHFQILSMWSQSINHFL